MKFISLIQMFAILIPIQALFAPVIDTADARVLRVPDQYATIALAAGAAEDDDIVEIASGTYTGTGIVATWDQDNITIRGTGGFAHLNADGVTISNRKAIWVVRGDAVTMENIEFSHARVPDENGAGIRHEGGDMTLRGCYFHDNENGILTSSNPSAEILIEYSEFDHNGVGEAGYTHNLYIGHIGKFTMRYSYSHHATHGHNVKTRAIENHILYNRIMDETSGNASYQIDIPNGGLSYIIGNTIHQGRLTENPTMISYAAEGASNPTQAIYVSANTMANDMDHPSRQSNGLRCYGSPDARVVNNIFDGFDTDWSGGSIVAEGNIQSDDNFFVDRANYDFHLTGNSPARNSAVSPGTGGGMDLTPVKEYAHPMDETTRLNDGRLDAGAFEYDAGLTAPRAGFSTDPANATGTAPLRVEFTDTSTGTPTSWQWDCDGDGTPDYSGPAVEHTYTSAGDYMVTLTVTNAAGTDSVSTAVTVTADSPAPGTPPGGSGGGGTSEGSEGNGSSGGCWISTLGPGADHRGTRR